MNSAQATATETYPRLRRFAADIGITCIFNTAIALAITYLMRVNTSFYVSFVVSMCIGLLMVSIVDGGRLLMWGTGRPPRLPFFLLFLMALPLSQFCGNTVASWILGIPRESISAVRSNNMVSFMTLFLLTCIAITWFFWSRGKMEYLKAQAEAEKARAAAIEKQAIQAQLQMLQAQIEPHMLFNTLANLQGLIAVDAQRAQHMLDQLIQYLRATLTSSRSEKTTLAHEFSLMDAYLSLMQVRMGARLSYRLSLPDELSAQEVPPMLMQPLVENAIKHGVEPKLGGGHIEVSATREGQTGMLCLRIADNGLGLDAKPAGVHSTHVGLANIRDRLRALYGERASFELLPNEPEGAVARLRIPS
ncbi:sensor histidine kinase [Noviherbaspirillum aerium]|uniref:sensor histidine kinase n=1 Tax=Noviherbaspirillum aerium TaxID=2588497 RepID=UPI00124D653A|nr:histidine kinase [Noviherbaspirillum aerium]